MTLDSLIEGGVSRKIKELTEWVKLLGYTKLNEDLICTDPKDLKRGIQYEHYKLPTKLDRNNTMRELDA